MADRDDSPKASSEQPAGHAPATKSEALPIVDSPSISPAKADELVADEPIAEGDSPIAPTPAVTPLRLALRRRRMAFLAASVTVAAALGAVIGAVAATTLAGSRGEVAGLRDRQVMQQSIARLGNELSTLKTNLEAARKSAHAQTAQLAKLSQALNEKLAASKANEALAQASAEVTGSIAAPQTTAPAEPETPLPPPRPQQLTALASQPQPIVSGWHVRGSARGTVLVESHGEIYEVVPGADLPGLGRVESIRRVDGRWIVATPKGLIVSSARDWRSFD
jgi:gas vesicle protein